MQINVSANIKQLWVFSFIEPKGPIPTKDEAAIIYSNIDVVCEVSTILFLIAISFVADKFNTKVMLPIVLLIDGVILTVFMFVENPSIFYAYILWSGQTMVKNLYDLLLLKFFSRNVPKEIRGLMFGTYATVG